MSRPFSIAHHLVGSLAALALVAGCGNPQVKPGGDTPSAAATGSVTVVGWSLRDQAPLGVQGAIRAEGGREAASFDTHLDAGQGTRFDLPAGHYRIEVSRRYAGDRSVAATGVEEIDIQPGEHLRREVVIDDRDDRNLLNDGK